MSEESKPPTLETDTSMLKETQERLKERLKEMQERLKQVESKKHELSHPASTSLLPYKFAGRRHHYFRGSTLSNKEMTGVILPMDLVKKDRMLPDHALLLKTLEELTEEQMETFQSYLTSPQQSNCLPIPRSQLKNTDRLNTVDQMVKYWGLLRAVRTTVRILKEINKHDLAVKLERDHTVSHPSSSAFYRDFKNQANRYQPLTRALHHKMFSDFTHASSSHQPSQWVQCLHVPALLLKTLEELTEEQMETFQSYLTSPQQSKYPPIPRSQLKNTDRLNTVDQMVKYWGLLRAVRTTVRILKEINKHDLAVKLEREYTEVSSRELAFSELFNRAGSSHQPSPQEDIKKHELSHPASTSLLPDQFDEPSCYYSGGSTWSNKEMSGVILPMDLVKKKDRMLPDQALLLKTLEVLTEKQMETFQFYLTSPQQSKYPPIPRSQLKNTDRQNTVDQMVKYWGLLVAVGSTVRILETINKHDLAVKLESDHIKAFYRDFKNQANLYQPLTRALHHKMFSDFTRAGSSHQPSQQEDIKKHELSHPASTSLLPDQFDEPSCYYSGGTTLSDEELSSVPLPLEPGIKRDQMLPLPALLLKTLEELTEEHLKTFQSYLTSPQRSDLPPIPKFELETADTRLTVGQMVWRYGPERAIEITVKILRKMDQNKLAKKLDCSQLMDSSSGIVSKETLDEDDRRRVKGKNRKQSNLMAPRGVLATLEELTDEQMETFQSILTSPLWYNYPPIPKSLVKNTDRQNTVGQMMWRYGPQRVVEITLKILRTIKRHDLAKKFEGKRRKKPSLPGPGSVKKRDENCVYLTDSSSGTLSDESSDRGDTEIQQDRDELDTKSISSLVKRSSQEDIWGASQQQEATSDAQAVDVQESGLSLDFKEEMEDSAFEPQLGVSYSLNTDMTDNNPLENIHGMDKDYETDSSVLEHPDMISTDEFTPEIHNPENGREYRFQCPCAGLFQCSTTGLVFGMEGEGDVVYRTVPWNRKLLAQSGKRPAGPLFNIYCPQMSVSQLHLPHCEIPSEGGCGFLSVAHVTDDSMELITPHKITETHLIINISGFSAYGDVKDEDSPTVPIRTLVLLFYKVPDVPMKRSILYVLLLPRNTVFREVQEEWRRRNGDQYIYIETNPRCQLTPNKKYSLFTELTVEHQIKPKEAEFLDYESYENYFPTFQLFLQTVVEQVDLLLKENDCVLSVWDRLVWLPASTTENTSTAPPINRPSTDTQPADTTAGTTRDVSFHLLETLMELNSEDLKTFKWVLTKGVDGFPGIPKGQMEDCDKPDTVDRMVETYCDDAVKVTLKILRSIKQNNLAETLQQKVLNTS
ncbi:uncharacterized protein LOC105031601 isoform X2 [Esox lucius]|uniref:uncharacterized protein LOC105031601 isoform X2 n=1 Tax=Esox lucius TaxID=8010 RepID=UPI001477690D|nr:uncharacterized protein LOC105031601 isoform X2 [Esox lucius]